MDQRTTFKHVHLLHLPSAKKPLGIVDTRARFQMSMSPILSTRIALICRDVGFSRPIAQLPGCNPAWPKSMDSKPTCSNPSADPEMVYPNVYFRNLLVSCLYTSYSVPTLMGSNELIFRLYLPMSIQLQTQPHSRAPMLLLWVMSLNLSWSLGESMVPTRTS